MLLPPWSVILIALLVVTQIMNPSERDFVWYRTLKRPGWINMHLWFPAAWFLINITIYMSTLTCWSRTGDWNWVAAYVVVLILLRSHPWGICRFRRLAIGLPLWLLSWLATLILALLVRPASPLASWLLVPALLWTPVEAIVTFQMIGLNLRQSRSGRGPDDCRHARTGRL
ncbi:MAG: hypothetical protein ER33_14900 [Cyanobium sp. CACIAM 14]|nr:MAG: hypothetical protein ER33_14900 [Cyanobium sp. CACIAM 14]